MFPSLCRMRCPASLQRSRGIFPHHTGVARGPCASDVLDCLRTGHECKNHKIRKTRLYYVHARTDECFPAQVSNAASLASLTRSPVLQPPRLSSLAADLAAFRFNFGSPPSSPCGSLSGRPGPAGRLPQASPLAGNSIRGTVGSSGSREI